MQLSKNFSSNIRNFSTTVKIGDAELEFYAQTEKDGFSCDYGSQSVGDSWNEIIEGSEKVEVNGKDITCNLNNKAWQIINEQIEL